MLFTLETSGFQAVPLHAHARPSPSQPAGCSACLCGGELRGDGEPPRPPSRHGTARQPGPGVVSHSRQFQLVSVQIVLN